MKRTLIGLLALIVEFLSCHAHAEIISMPDYSDADIQYVSNVELDKLGNASPFVRQYVAALRSRQFLAYQSLLHPSSQACVTSDNLDFFQAIVDQDTRMKVPLGDSFKVGLLAVTKTDGADRDTRPPLRLSIAPTHILVVSYGDNNSGSSLIRFLVQEANRFTAVLPCPNVEMLSRFRAMAKSKR